MRFSSALGLTTATSATSFLLNMAASALLGRALGPAGYGTYALLTAAMGLIGVLTDPRGERFIHAVVLANHPSLTKTAMWIMLRQVGLAGAFLTALLLFAPETARWLIGLLVGRGGDLDHRILWLLVPGVVATGLTAHLLSIRLGRHDFISFGAMAVTQSFVTALGASVLLATRGYRTPAWALACWVLANVAGSLVGLAASSNTSAPSTPGPTSTYSWGIGFRAYSSNVLGILITRISYGVLAIFSTQAALGLFAAATALAELMSRVPSLISQVALPYSAGSTEEVAVTRNAQLTRMCLSLLVASGIGLLVAGPLLARGFFGPRFSGTYPVLCALIPGMVCLGATTCLNFFLAARRFPWALHVASMASLIANTALTAYLSPRYGAVGAALATSGGYGVWLASLVWYVRRRYGVSPRTLLIPRMSDLAAIHRAFRALISRIFATTTVEGP